MQEFWSAGTLTAKTRCWAQGMDGWRPLQSIPQLKWCLLAAGQAVMNETDLATLILNMLITMCSYFPSRYSPALSQLHPQDTQREPFTVKPFTHQTLVSLVRAGHCSSLYK